MTASSASLTPHLPPRVRVSARGTLTAVLCIVIIAALLIVAARATADILVSAPRPGRVFFDGEPVRLGLLSRDRTLSVRCLVFDYRGRVVARLTSTVPAGKYAQLRIGRLPRGWYELRLRRRGGGEQKDAFCVLPPMEDRGRHYRLFGACATLDRQDLADYLSLAGLRCVRRDWGWPTIEPWNDRWSPDFTRGIMTRAQKAGLEYLPIVGYAPRFVRSKPVDAAGGRPLYAQHTWPISDKTEWVEFLQWCKNFARRFRPVLWPPPRLAPDADYRQKMASVAGWEIWNEADQAFYYGPWHQYCDLLRLAHGVLDDLDSPVIYGGSCGHWTETGMAYRWGLRNFFDMAAGHGGHEVDESLPRWRYGAYSIGYKCNMPYRLLFTEGYFRYDPGGRTFAEYVLPMYAKLRHWGVEAQYRGFSWYSCTEVSRETAAMAFNLRSGLAPTPAYVAMAFARYMLVDAAYVGRIELRPRLWAFIFLRGGTPLAIIWNEGEPTRVSVRLSEETGTPRAWFEFLGQEHRIRSRARAVSILAGTSPAVVTGVAWSVAATAASARLDEFLSSQFGAQPRDGLDRWSCYVRKLRDDLRWLLADEPAQATAAAAEAFSRLASDRPQAYSALEGAVEKWCQLMLSLSDMGHDPARPRGVPNALWRAMSVTEWLAELADEVGTAAGESPATDDAIATTRAAVRSAWRRAVLRSKGAARPRARTLARRAWASFRRAASMRGPLSLAVARAEAEAAARWARSEPPVLTHALAVAQFPTAQFLVKAHMLAPGRSHIARLIVSNQSRSEVAGRVVIQFPAGWEPRQAEVDCVVAPGAAEVVGEVEFTIPGDPPWVEKSAWRPAGPLTIFAPEQLPAQQQVEVWLEANGLAAPHSYYYFNIGSLTMPPEEPPPPPSL